MFVREQWTRNSWTLYFLRYRCGGDFFGQCQRAPRFAIEWENAESVGNYYIRQDWRVRSLLSGALSRLCAWCTDSHLLVRMLTDFALLINIRPDREAVLAELGRIARDEFQGRVTRNMITSLYIARRRP